MSASKKLSSEQVKAVLDEGIYLKGQKVSRKDVDGLNLTPHEVCSEWNYTIRPSQ